MPLDARFTHRGTYSSWLSKAKGDGAKAKWLSGACRRYFTIDFDNQIFHYSHTESGKDASIPISFSELLTAEQGAEERIFCPSSRASAASRQLGPQLPPALTLGAPLQSLAVRMASALGSSAEDTGPQTGGLRRSLSLTSMMPRRSAGSSGEFPFIVQTRDRRMKLCADREADARDWVDLLNAAARLGQGLSTEKRQGRKDSESWPPDYSVLPPNMFARFAADVSSKSAAKWTSEKQEPSEKSSQEASTAEGASECGSASPAASSCAGEEGGSCLLKERLVREDTESTGCSGVGPDGSVGIPSPSTQRGHPDDEALEEVPPPLPQSAWQESKPWEAQPAEPRRLQAADFGFEDEDLEDEEDEEASPESSPCRRAMQATRAWAAPEVSLGAAADQGSNGAIASTAAAGQGARAGVVAGRSEEPDDGEGSDDESPAHEGAQRASRVAADLQLVARALAAGARPNSCSAASGGCAVAAGAEKPKKSKTRQAKQSEPRAPSKHVDDEAETAGRIAADLMLVQRAQAAAAHRHSSKAARVPGRSRGGSELVMEAF